MVISIIAVLAGLFFPVLGRVIESSRSSKCVANLRSLAVAGQLYAGENDGKVVPVALGTGASDAQVWRSILLPYLGNDATLKPLMCPSDTWGLKTVTSPYMVGKGTQPTSYGVNFYSGTSNGTVITTDSYHDYLGNVHGNKIVNIQHPARTIFLADTGRPNSVTVAIPKWSESTRAATNASFGYAKMPAGRSPWATGDFCIYPRHSGTRANAAFYDGHVESLDLVKDIVAHGINDPKCLYDYH